MPCPKQQLTPKQNIGGAGGIRKPVNNGDVAEVISRLCGVLSILAPSP